MEERPRRLAVMAQKLSGSSGSDARHISNRKAEMSALWDGLKVCTTQGEGTGTACCVHAGERYVS